MSLAMGNDILSTTVYLLLLMMNVRNPPSRFSREKDWWKFHRGLIK